MALNSVVYELKMKGHRLGRLLSSLGNRQKWLVCALGLHFEATIASAYISPVTKNHYVFTAADLHPDSS